MRKKATTRNTSMDDMMFYLVDGIYANEYDDGDVETGIFEL